MGLLRHFLEQYFTLGHSRAHFFRQVKGLPQVAHTFRGKADFLLVRGIGLPVESVHECFGHAVMFRHLQAELVFHLDHHRFCLLGRRKF